jgi:predicted alpha/beta hydrolase
MSVSAAVFTATDGHALAGYRFDPESPPLACVVIAPAMAVPQSFYAGFARWLAAQGYAVCSFDYRGTGESLRGPPRGAPGTLDDWMAKDYDAVLQQMHRERPGLPLFAIGHSFGGQCAPLLPSRRLLAGLVNIAVGSGAMRHNTPAIRRTAPLLWYVLVPLFCPLLGYFPGARLGVIGDLPTGAVRQWRRWCLSPDYLLGAEPSARPAYASAPFPVLALTFADDELLLEEGSRLLHSAYPNGRVDYRVLDPQEFQLSRIGHSGFFRPAGEARLWPLVRDWLADTARHPAPRGMPSPVGPV